MLPPTIRRSTSPLLTSLLGCSVFILMAALSLAGAQTQAPMPVPRVQIGMASWYGAEFHGRRTANGEQYDMFQFTAAHKSAPLGIHAVVTSLDTGRAVRVRINDRGPFVRRRILDLSYAAARQLGMVHTGLARVKIEFLPDTAPILAFIVQAGAYRDRGNAIRVHRMLATRYPNVWIAVVRDNAHIFYRVRIGNFSDRAEAERVAHRVQTLGYAARVMPDPQQPAASFSLSANKL